MIAHVLKEPGIKTKMNQWGTVITYIRKVHVIKKGKESFEGHNRSRQQGIGHLKTNGNLSKLISKWYMALNKQKGIYG